MQVLVVTRNIYVYGTLSSDTLQIKAPELNNMSALQLLPDWKGSWEPLHNKYFMFILGGEHQEELSEMLCFHSSLIVF